MKIKTRSWGGGRARKKEKNSKLIKKAFKIIATNIIRISRFVIICIIIIIIVAVVVVFYFLGLSIFLSFLLLVGIEWISTFGCLKDPAFLASYFRMLALVFALATASATATAVVVVVVVVVAVLFDFCFVCAYLLACILYVLVCVCMCVCVFVCLFLLPFYYS